MTAPTGIYEGFSVTHAQILDGSQTFEQALETALANPQFWDIYGVDEASITPNVDNFENPGDDAVQSRWQWFTTADLRVRAGYVSFPLLSTIYGNPISSTGTGAARVDAMELWNERSINIPDRPVMIVQPSKDSRGAIRRLVWGCYRVSFGPLTPEGIAYKDGLKVSYPGTVLMSEFNEVGAQHPAMPANGVFPALPAGAKRTVKLIATV